MKLSDKWPEAELLSLLDARDRAELALSAAKDAWEKRSHEVAADIALDLSALKVGDILTADVRRGFKGKTAQYFALIEAFQLRRFSDEDGNWYLRMYLQRCKPNGTPLRFHGDWVSYSSRDNAWGSEGWRKVGAPVPAAE